MTPIQRLISAGFASAALAAAAVPALAWTVWPDIDFEWYANAARPLAAESAPAPRAGYIWSPGHWQNGEAGRQWIDGRWVRDDYREQVATYAAPTYGNGRMLLSPRGDAVSAAPEPDSTRR